MSESWNSSFRASYSPRPVGSLWVIAYIDVSLKGNNCWGQERGEAKNVALVWQYNFAPTSNMTHLGAVNEHSWWCRLHDGPPEGAILFIHIHSKGQCLMLHHKKRLQWFIQKWWFWMNGDHEPPTYLKSHLLYEGHLILLLKLVNKFLSKWWTGWPNKFCIIRQVAAVLYIPQRNLA